RRPMMPYEAVSYLWGSAELRETIWIGGRWLRVTASVFELLGRLRAAQGRRSQRRGRHEYLWVDAICINQADDVEKSQQVQQMRHVYATARRVIFHLGPPTSDTDLLMEGLWRLQMSSREKQGAGSLEHSLAEEDGEAWRRVRSRLGRRHANVWVRQHNALHELLGRSWFERVWVVQEVWNARDGIVHCGRWAVSCRVFVAAPELLNVHVAGQRKQILDAMPSSPGRLAATTGGQERDLYAMLQSFRNAAATNERDRIYALLGLCGSTEDNGRGPLLTDYTVDEAEVVRNTIAYLCGCSVACLPRDPSATVRSFLSNLPTL
ncbi:heterokaryon incompatibility protein-domain-containing protein, partial [Microdochium bolleyi]